MKSYAGKVVVVTGASSGLGRQFALDLAKQSATVIGVARREELLKELGLPYRVCDVSDTKAFAQVLADIERENGRIDILVNNAGIGEMPPFDDSSVDDYRSMLETNFFAAVAGTLYVVPGMKARRSGVIVNVSSDAARAPEPGNGAYSSSKAALSAFTESISYEVEAVGVRVHVLYPAWVPTAMGQGAVDDEAMPLPPKAVRRTAEQVSKLLLDKMGGPVIAINASKLPMVAPIARTIFERGYRYGIKRAFSER